MVDNKNTRMTKVCKACQQDLPVSSYYKACGTTLTTLCKVCHNKKRIQHQKDNPKPKKVVGFLKLEESVRTAVLKDITDGMNYKRVASTHKINYITLLRWKDKGLLVYPI